MLKSAAEVIDLTLSDDEGEAPQVKITKPIQEESKVDDKDHAPPNPSPA